MPEGLKTNEASTSKALPATGLRIHPEMVWALALVKKAAAAANAEVGLLAPDIARAIEHAASELASGALDGRMSVNALWSAAAINACVNDAIAGRAAEALRAEPVDPLDHVNLNQSANEVFPTALKLASIKLGRALSGAMAHLQGALQSKEREFASVVKVGRTGLQDDVPISLGQEFGAYAEAVSRDWSRLVKAEERLRQVNFGGTAVGTGLNAPRLFGFRVVEILRECTGFALAKAENAVDATQNLDVFSEVSGFLKTAAVNLMKIARDLCLLCSGPRAGLGEINLPGESSSPVICGRADPVVPELAMRVALQVMANDVAIGMAAASGLLEGNAFLPLIAHDLLWSLDAMAAAAEALAECVRKAEANRERCRELLEKSPSLAVAFSPYLGRETAGAVALEAASRGRTVAEVVLERGLLSEEEVNAILDPTELTTPGIAGSKAVRQRRAAKGGRSRT